MADFERPKIGFVASGGALYGAYQAGAIHEVVSKYGIKPDYLLAMSAGSLNLAAACINKEAELVEAWANLTRSKVYSLPVVDRFSLFNRFPALNQFFRGEVKLKSVFDHSRMLDLMLSFCDETVQTARWTYDIPLAGYFLRVLDPSCPSDEEKETLIGKALVSSPIEYGVLVTNMQRNEPELFTNQEQRVRKNPALLAKAVLASCAVPLLFPPIDIGGYQYFDGELKVRNPFEQAVRAGCDRIIFFYTPISCGIQERRFETIPEIVLRAIEANIYQDRTDQELLQEALEKCGRAGQDVRVLTITPDKPLPQLKLGLNTKFHKPTLEQLIEEGRERARNELLKKAIF